MRRQLAQKKQRLEELKRREEAKKKNELLPKLPPPPPKKLDVQVIIDQLVKRSVATLRDKLSNGYPEEYILDLSILRNDPLFSQNTLNLFKKTNYKTFDSLLSSLFAKEFNTKYKFQYESGKGIVDLQIVKSIDFSTVDDFTVLTRPNGNSIDDLKYELLDNLGELRFSNFKKDTKFSFSVQKEKEIIDAMKSKKLQILIERMSKKLLEKEDFYLKKSENPYNVLSDTVYTKKMINSLNEKGLNALKKYFKIKSENNNDTKQKLLKIPPARIITAEKKASS